ncbi:MAG: sigma-70 family RNA polymerase sigma factor, partial [Phycisphaerae bacterium]
PSEAAAHDMLKARIESVLKTLTYREREIIKLRYGIGDGYTYTLEEVGRIFKVTRERVRQVEAKAIRKLQHPVRARKLQGFVDGSIYKEVRAEMSAASNLVEREQLINRVGDIGSDIGDIDDSAEGVERATQEAREEAAELEREAPDAIEPPGAFEDDEASDSF